MIPFNKPLVIGTELSAIETALQSSSFAGRNTFTQRCEKWLSDSLHGAKVLLTTSGTAALEIAAILCGIQPGDEVIAPSYTFVSTVNAFVLRGAKIVFVDVEPGTMNLATSQLKDAITKKTRAIVPVHYNGVACDMDTIMALAEEHSLLVVEDAAQALHCTHKGRGVGSRGHISCISFHETKNMTAGGQGGAVVVNAPSLIARAEVVFDYGTNRSSFFRGEVDRYEWIDIGSNYFMPEVQAAFLWAQLQVADEVRSRRLRLWNAYHASLLPLHQQGKLTLPPTREERAHAGHIFHFFLDTPGQRVDFIRWMKEAGITVSAHYVPLHSAPYGREKGRFAGADVVTTIYSQTLVRLPMFYAMRDDEQETVIARARAFFEQSSKLNDGKAETAEM